MPEISQLPIRIRRFTAIEKGCYETLHILNFFGYKDLDLATFIYMLLRRCIWIITGDWG